MVTEFGGLGGGNRPYGIARGADGNLWFTEDVGNLVGRITPTGTVTEFGGLTLNSQPTSIVKGPAHTLWFTERTGNRIGRVTVAACDVAETISASGGTFTRTTAGGSTLAGSCGGPGPEWVFQWTPDRTGTAQLQTCGSGTDIDTVLYLRGGACEAGSEVACNDDSCPNAGTATQGSRLTPFVTAGQTYFIVVDGFGAGKFQLTVVPPQAGCDAPEIVPGSGGSYLGTVVGASTLQGSCGGAGPERVFEWTPDHSGPATIQTCGSGTNFDTVLLMRHNDCHRGDEAACNDDACANATTPTRASVINTTVTAGDTYFIIVDSYNEGGNYTLDILPPTACDDFENIPAAGGVFTRSTVGETTFTGTCGGSGPEKVFRWVPATSGTATIDTCAGATFETLLYVRQGDCLRGAEVACNQVALCKPGLFASRVYPNVVAGQAYYIVVDAVSAAGVGDFTLTVAPPGAVVPTATRTPTAPATATRTPTTALPPASATASPTATRTATPTVPVAVTPTVSPTPTPSPTPPASPTPTVLTLVVNTTSDTSEGTCDATHCSLREAAALANFPGRERIVFNIPGSDPGCDASGVCTIHATASLAELTDGGTEIDGFTQPGASPNTNPVGEPINAALKIVLDGSQAPFCCPVAVSLRSSGNTVRGLVITNFYSAIEILDSTDNHVEGNFIGTDASGTAAAGSHCSGVVISALHDGSMNNVVGGPAPQARNLISGNQCVGVEIGRHGSNTVQGNYIGTDASGKLPLPNGSGGVRVFNISQDNAIGGTGTGEANLIAYNEENGVEIDAQAGAAVRNRISGNRITGNAGKGIALVGGGNDGLAAPFILGAAPTQATGTACAGCTVEVFSDADDEGAVFEGAVVATGAGTWSLDKPGGFAGPYLTGTATDLQGNTSEFSAPAALSVPTSTPTRTASAPPTATRTPTPTVTMILTPTPTDTPAPTATGTPTPTRTRTSTITPTGTPPPTAVATGTFTPSPTPTSCGVEVPQVAPVTSPTNLLQQTLTGQAWLTGARWLSVCSEAGCVSCSIGSLNCTATASAFAVSVPLAPLQINHVQVCDESPDSCGGPVEACTTVEIVQTCAGDCGGTFNVTVDELLTMVKVALGNADVSACTVGDANHDSYITIDEILTAVHNALNGCPT